MRWLGRSSIAARWRVVAVLGLRSAGVPAGPADGQAEPRFIAAVAECRPAEGNRPGSVRVVVKNETGGPLRVLAVEGANLQLETWPSAPVSQLAPLASLLVVVIADDEDAAIEAPWIAPASTDVDAGLTGGAIVVTTLGMLVAVCVPDGVETTPDDDGAESDDVVPSLEQDIVDEEDPAGVVQRESCLEIRAWRPTTTDGRRLEEARAMAQTIGQLEAWRAYDLLHALLHPDAQAMVDVDRLTCWYAIRLDTPDEPATRSIPATSVTVAGFRPWTWPVTGATYRAAVTYGWVQRIEGSTVPEAISGTGHLVEVEGVWRWFFGSSREAIDALPATCEGVW